MQRLITIAASAFAVALAGYVWVAREDSWTVLTPWAIGVVLGSLILAVLAGEAFRFLKLPRVLGYVTIGLVTIPLHDTLLSIEAIALGDPRANFEAWRPLYLTALAFTGAATGLRCESTILRNDSRGVILHSLVPPLLVGAGVAALMWAGVEFFGLAAPVSILGLTLAGLVASTSSPVAIYSVNSELHSEGTMPALQAMISVVKGGLVLAAVGGLVSFSGMDSAALRHSETLVSIALPIAKVLGVGVLGGLALLAALRWASGLVVVVAVSAAAVLGLTWTGGELPVLAAGLIAGIIATNGSRFAFQLGDSMDRATPVFLSAVFVFAIGQLDLPVDSTPWLFALIAMPVRGVLAFVGAGLAERMSRQQGGRHLPYSMFAQSLLALFVLKWLVTVDSTFTPLSTLLAPLVVLNLYVGSILHRTALVRSGTVHFAPESDQANIIVHPSDRRAPPREASALDDDRSLLPKPRFADPALRSSRLNDLARRIRQRLIREQDHAASRFFDPRRSFVSSVLDEVERVLQAHCLETFQELRDTGDSEERRRAIRDRRADLEAELQDLFLVFGPTHEPGDLAETVTKLEEGVKRACQVDLNVRAPEEDVLREVRPGDNVYIQLRKKLHAANTRFGPRPMRTVPVRSLATTEIAGALPERLHAAINLDGRFRIYLWMRIDNAFQEVSALYLRTLERLDLEVKSAAAATGSTQVGVVEETVALEEFDRRLRASLPTEAEHEEVSDVEPILEDEASEAPDDVVLAGWAEYIEELPVRLEDLRRDILDFEADVRRRFALAIDAGYQQFLEDLAVAGTFALPARALTTRRRSEEEREHDATEEEIKHWRQLAMAFTDRRAMHLGFRTLEHQLRGLLDEFVGKVETELCAHLTYYPAEISERCEDVVTTLGETFAAQVSNADLSDAFVQIRHNLSDFLQEDALQSVQEMREEEVFTNLVRRFVNRLEEMVRDQRSLYVVADESFLDRPETAGAADVPVDDVPIQDILDRQFVRAVAGSLNELAMRVATVVDRVATGLGEVNRIISFNLDAAATELRTDADAEVSREVLAEFAIGGIRRAGENAGELLQQVQEEVNGIDDEILERTVEHVRTTRRFLFDDSMGRFERLALSVDGERSQFRARSSELWAEVRERLEAAREQVSRPVDAVQELARERFSLREFGREEFLEDAMRANFETVEISTLPLAYRRLFTPTPVEIQDIYLVRDYAREDFESALERWRAGHRVSVVVTGEHGVGKTSFLHRTLASSLNDAKMLRWNVRQRLLTEAELCNDLSRLFGIRRVTTVPRLLAALADMRGKRTAVVVDGIERLFLRTMAGSEALMCFLSLVSQAPADIMWLVTANDSLWTYVATMFSADDFFTDRIDLELLSPEQTEELIMSRHRVSGYRLEFVTDGAEALTPNRFLEGAQDRLRRRYFRRLWEATRGHPLTALYYWLTSVELSDDDTTLCVSPPRALRVDHLRKLDADKLIGLGQIVLHEELTEAGFAQIMRVDVAEAKRDLAFFESLHLVVRERGRDVQYRVNDVLHHDLERALQERNLV